MGLAVVKDGPQMDFWSIWGLVLSMYGIVPPFQKSHFHRVYAAYGGIFIIMALVSGMLF